MQLMCWIVDYMASFIEVFFFLQLAAVLFRKKGSKQLPVTILTAAAWAGIIILCNHISTFSYITAILCILFDSFACKYMFQIKYIISLSLSAFYWLCMSVLDFLVVAILAFFQHDDQFLNTILAPGKERILLILFVKTIWVLLYFLVKWIFQKVTYKNDRGYAVLVLSAGGFIGFVYCSWQTLSAFSQYLARRWISFAVIIILILFLVLFFLENRDAKMKLEYNNLRNSLLEEKYQAVSEVYERNARLYHDFNHHLNVLYHLLNDDKTMEARNYLTRISEPVRELSARIWTGIDIVDVIINSELDRMAKIGIHCNPDLNLPPNAGFADNDLCTIFSNLLDNAIEATEKVTDADREILFAIHHIKSFILIQIENPFTGKRNLQRLTTTKKNKDIHGWGIKNVISAVEKYDGSFKYEAKDGRFKVSILMFLPQKSIE